jgi:anti-sigma B factor antagonist
MTVVPLADELAQLICDGCGVVITVGGTPLTDDELAWPIIANQGWDGSPFVIGPHRCPSCAVKADQAEAKDPIARTDVGAAEGGPPSWRRVALRGGAAAVLFRPSGDLTAAATEAVDRALADAVPLGRHLVVEMTDVKVIEPPCLALLVRTHQEVKRRGGVVCLVGPSRFVVTVLHTMRLDGVFPYFDDCVQALDWLDDSTGGVVDTASPPQRRRSAAVPRVLSTGRA